MTVAALRMESDNHSMVCSGEWTLIGIATIAPQFKQYLTQLPNNTIIDGSEITKLDSAGAWLLEKLIQQMGDRGLPPQLVGFTAEHQSLLRWIHTEAQKVTQLPARISNLPWIERVGQHAIEHFTQFLGFLGFLGEIFYGLWRCLCFPKRLPWRSFFHEIAQTGYRALPIVALLSFLIGVVLTYQMGQQLETYGANIYIVSLLGIGVLQEFGPLITAIILVSRTGSAFTAELGTMRVQAEIDALQTMGISPIERLVLPKILGLLVAMPLLIVWADVFGMLGGMFVAQPMLQVSFYNFVLHFPEAIQLSTFLNGLIKAPVFAAIIASVGCFQGFQVGYTAESIGKHTTQSVVQAIFLIVIMDAIFSVFLPWQNI